MAGWWGRGENGPHHRQGNHQRKVGKIKARPEGAGDPQQGLGEWVTGPWVWSGSPCPGLVPGGAAGDLQSHSPSSLGLSVVKAHTHFMYLSLCLFGATSPSVKLMLQGVVHALLFLHISQSTIRGERVCPGHGASPGWVCSVAWPLQRAGAALPCNLRDSGTADSQPNHG